MTSRRVMRPKVYKPQRAVGYEWALPVDANDYERIRTLGERRRAGEWSPIPVQLVTEDEDGRQAARADLPWLGVYALVLGPAAVEVLKPLVAGDAELLRLDCAAVDLCLLHVWRTVDALLEDQSEIVRYPSSGRIMEIERATFDASKLHDVRVFRLPQFLRGPMYLTDEVVQEARSAGLTGTVFSLVTEGAHLT